MATKRPTSREVAAEAGVSRATVSYVLNGTAGQKISQATRERVLAASRQLGYVPSVAAATLRSGRTKVVLSLLPDWPFVSTTGKAVTALTAAFAEFGLVLVIHPHASDRTDFAYLWAALTPAAVLVYHDLDGRQVDEIRAAGIELTVAMVDRTDLTDRFLMAPEREVGRAQVDRLFDGGCRRIGYAYPTDARIHGFADLRLDGARARCTERGLPHPEVQLVDSTAESGAAAVQHWFTADPEQRWGVCAFDDLVAMAVISGAHRRRLDVPERIAVIGVDDNEGSALFSPPITTVIHDFHAIGRNIAAQVAAALDGRAVQPPAPAPIHLIARGSA